MKFGFLYHLHGVLQVRLVTSSPEVFINSCRNSNIKLKNISFRNDSLIFDIRAYDLIKARKLRLTKGSGVSILSKKGFFRHFLPLVERPLLFIGFTFAFSFVMFMSLFIWDVRITSDGTDNRILSASVESLGLKPGILKSTLDNEKIKNLLLLKHDELGWIAVNVTGCRANISYSLLRQTPELIAKDEPCDVVSSRLAVIKRVDTYKGTCLVLPGDTVFPGDKIISSEVIISDRYSEAEVKHFVHARGDVWGRTWYDLTAHSPAVIGQKTYLDKIKRKVYLITPKNSIEIPLSYGNQYGKYDIIIKEYALGFGLYIQTETREYYTLEQCSAHSDLSDVLATELQNVLLGSMDRGRIVSSVISENCGEDYVSVNLMAECVEQIGVQNEVSTNDYGS